MHCICRFLYFISTYDENFSYEISKKSICTKTSRDHFDLKRSFLINFSPRKTVNNLFDAVFRALSNGVFKIVILASLHEKTSSEQLSQFLVDIRYTFSLDKQTDYLFSNRSGLRRTRQCHWSIGELRATRSLRDVSHSDPLLRPGCGR